MESAVRTAVLRHVTARRFDRLVALLGDLYADAATDALGHALDAARACERLADDVQQLRRTIADLERQIDLEIRSIRSSLGLDRPVAQPTLVRWWHRIRARSAPAPPSGRAPPTGREADGSSQSLAAYGLGHFQVLIDGVPVQRWISRKGQAVLKLLLIRGGPLHREELMASLWPDTGYAQARNRLNVAIHGLRQSLGATQDRRLVVFEGGRYQFDRDVDRWFDVDEFEERKRRGQRHQHAGYTEAAMSEFRRAAALYRGDLFAEERHSDWADGARRALRHSYLRILDDLGERALERGDLRGCLHWSERLLDAEPWSESAHARVMRVHARQGQAHLALRQFVECTRILREELGVTPSRSLIELYDEVRASTRS